MSLVTVPKITIIMRKSYGQAYINMGGGRNCDEFVCWPTADLGFMDAAVGANVLVGDKTDDSGKRKEVQEAIAQDTSAWGLAELFEAYDAQCHREGVADFPELLLRSYELLYRNEPLRQHYRDRFKHILIDEFQDTNTLQYR